MVNIRSIIKKVISGILLPLNISFAAQGSPEQAMELKQSIQAVRSYQNEPGKSIVLPVSPGNSQWRTCLCWTYAFFNALETLHLVKHPDEQMILSRGVMQYLNIEDRVDLKIAGIEDHLDPKVYKDCWAEGGTPLSADYIVKNYGAAQEGEYAGVVQNPDYTELYYSLFTDKPSTPKEKRALAERLIQDYFVEPIPETVNFKGQSMSRLDFANAIVPQGHWQTFAISKEGKEYIGPGLDSDARRNEQTHFVPKEKLIQLFNHSLEEQKPIIFTAHNHVVLIYGADYQKSDVPETVYIKDSYDYNGFFYKADFQKVLNEMLEMTMLIDENH